MPRAQNAYAQVNAAFLYEFDQIDSETIILARIVFGGLSGQFTRARHTEQFLIHKKIFTNEVLQGALKVLHDEICTEFIPGDLEPEYKKKCALGLF
jgi:xanthine dehydrogenase/oxidase